MLVLERRVGTKISVADLVEVEVLEVRTRNRVKLGITAPRTLEVRRGEHCDNDASERTPVEAPRVTIIEDDPAFARLLSMAFARAGVESCRSVRGYADAMAMIDAAENEAAPALILCDQELGDGWGTDVVRRIRETPALRRTPVVMLSSHTEASFVDASLDAGANAYMDKSVAVDRLTYMVRQLLSFWCNDAMVREGVEDDASADDGLDEGGEIVVNAAAIPELAESGTVGLEGGQGQPAPKD